MKGLMNFLWHIPFLGFLWALAYAIGGVFACITIIFIPVGLAWFHIARYLLSPFSQAMVSKSDLKLLNPKAGDEGSDGWQIYCNIIGIIWLPFGALCCLGAIFSMIIDGISIIGIPLVYIWSRLLKTFLWPVNKVCVPITVANEIERIKANAEYASITGQNIPGQVLATQANTVAQPAAQAPATKQKVEEDVIANQTPLEAEVRSYDISKLQEIINNASMYNAQMVAQCRKEITIREESEAFVEQVKGFEISKLREIVKNSHLYSEALVYAAWVDLTERNRIQKEQLDREEAEARARREKEEAEKRERQQQWLKKNRWWISTIIIVFCASIFGIGYMKHINFNKYIDESKNRVTLFLDHAQKSAKEAIEYDKKAKELAADVKSWEVRTSTLNATNKAAKFARDAAARAQLESENFFNYGVYMRDKDAVEAYIHDVIESSVKAEEEAKKAKEAYEAMLSHAGAEHAARVERAERERIAAAEQAERDRIAAAEQAERDRIAAAEQAENERINQMLKEGKGRDGIYKIGDYYKQGNLEGIVFTVDASGRHGKLLSLKYSTTTWNDAIAKYPTSSQGWYLPSIDELQQILKNKETLENALKAKTLGYKLSSKYWSSNEADSNNAKTVLYSIGVTTSPKNSKQSVRAICKF